MSHLEEKHARAVFLRVKAEILRTGDKEARKHARELRREANTIDTPQHAGDETLEASE